MKRARLQWIPESKGGRKKPPTGNKYIAPAKFDGVDMPESEQGLWSLVIQMSNPTDQSEDYFYANVFFLFDSAPQHLLKKSNRFSLFEGGAKVAKGLIVE